MKPIGVEFQVCAYYSTSLLWFGYGFFVPALHPPAFLQHPKLIMPVWAVMMLMKSISFLLVIALSSPGRNPAVFLVALLWGRGGGCSPQVWDPGPCGPSQGLQACGPGTKMGWRWAPSWGFCLPY